MTARVTPNAPKRVTPDPPRLSNPRVRQTDSLSEAERARILAKSALFNPPAHVLADGRRDLVGLSREELATEMAEIG